MIHGFKSSLCSALLGAGVVRVKAANTVVWCKTMASEGGEVAVRVEKYLESGMCFPVRILKTY